MNSIFVIGCKNKMRTKSVCSAAILDLKSHGIGATEIARKLGIGRVSVYPALGAEWLDDTLGGGGSAPIAQPAPPPPPPTPQPAAISPERARIAPMDGRLPQAPRLP
jgi:hypothetical protein